MNIKRIHMYRYGMFSDKVFEFPSLGLQVVYGVNEAGKSTMMRFIHDVLFGFSARSPGISENGDLYGGALAVETPSLGKVTIERTGNRGKGAVKVFFEDGLTLGEDALRELLPGLDASMFRAIFSFGLDGLEGLEHIDAEEINDYLFHAGMAGDLSIRELEKKLANKQAELFKPQGRKPLLNQQLAELESLQKDVAAWQNKNDGYRRLTEEVEKIRQRINRIDQTKSKLKKNIRWLEKQKALTPYVTERQELQLRLKRLSAYEPFPEDGINRFDHWRTQAVALEAERAELEAKRKSVADKSKEITVNEEWLDLKDEVRREREQERYFQSRQNEQAAHERAVEAEEEELAALMEKLGPVWTQKRITEANTSIAAKEALREHVQERQSLFQRREVLEQERIRLEHQIQQNQREKAQITGKRLSVEERRKLDQSVRWYEEAEHLESRQTQRKTRASSINPVFYIGTGLATVLVLWMISGGKWWTAAVTAVLTAVFGFYVMRSARGSERLKDGREDQGRKSQHPSAMSIEEVQRAKIRLEEDDRMRQTEAIVADRLVNTEKTHADTNGQIEAVMKKINEVDEKILAWCRDFRFPDGMKDGQLFETFERVEEAKMRIRRRNREQKACQNIERERKKRENKISRLCRLFGIDFENSMAALNRMSERIEEQERKLLEKRKLEDKLSEYERQIHSLKEKIDRYNKECNALMSAADTKSEEAYRHKGEAWRESREILKDLASVEAKMESFIPDGEKRKEMIATVLNRKEDEDAEIHQLENELETFEEEEQQLYERMAKVRQEQEFLEEGGTYAQLLHQFEQKKDEFRSGARKWAVYRTAEHLLRKAKEEYRNRRLPQVIEGASRYFSRMTDGRYTAVYAPVDQGFVVERADGARFFPKQLSRGTAEQLYLSIRMALAGIYHSLYPLIMDDILVNFDSDRTKHAVEAIRELAHDHQVLFFTCHEHLLSHFHDSEIVSISDRLSLQVR